jgi:hypothetical protein
MFTLPSNGVLSLGASSVLTLSSDAVFKPECTGTSSSASEDTTYSFNNLRDPFYASTIPECYALAATTVIAYMLVIMLLITPRTFLHEGAVVLGRRGFTNGPSGSDAGIGIGGRPWLQKVAALTVAVSLTIATADTFKVAEFQYENGYMDARALQDRVEDGMELKIVRVISDTFLWLAQAQTLIRLSSSGQRSHSSHLMCYSVYSTTLSTTVPLDHAVSWMQCLHSPISSNSLLAFYMPLGLYTIQ